MHNSVPRDLGPGRGRSGYPTSGYGVWPPKSHWIGLFGFLGLSYLINFLVWLYFTEIRDADHKACRWSRQPSTGAGRSGQVYHAHAEGARFVRKEGESVIQYICLSSLISSTSPTESFDISSIICVWGRIMFWGQNFSCQNHQIPPEFDFRCSHLSKRQRF